jgi:hypothetical protein
VGETWFPPRCTERAGFEPATHLSARTRFPVALLRPLGHLSVLRSGEGGIRTLDGGIHPHNALAGRRLQPLGHFSARGAQDSRGFFGRRTHGQSPHVLQAAPPRRRLRGRRLQPLGHFSARGAQDSRGFFRRPSARSDPPSGGGKLAGERENELAGSPLIPRHLKPVCGYPRRVSSFRSSSTIQDCDSCGGGRRNGRGTTTSRHDRARCVGTSNRRRRRTPGREDCGAVAPGFAPLPEVTGAQLEPSKAPGAYRRITAESRRLRASPRARP